MVHKVKSHALGKLLIYIEPSHKVRHGERSLFRKVFPKSAYMHIITEAKKEGILNASVYHTHMGYSNMGAIRTFSVEGDNSSLSVCVELIDKREKLENFFLQHKELLQSKVVIYKEVEFWDIEKS
jgi:PII-like signaling protein